MAEETFTDGEGSYLSDRWRLTGWPTNRDERKNLRRDLIDFAVLTSGSLDAYLDILLSTTPYSDGPYITDLSAGIAYDLCDRRMKAIKASDQREVVRLNEAERDFRNDFPLQFSDEVWWTNPSTLLPEILQRKRPERIAAIVRALESAASASVERATLAMERQKLVMPILAKKTQQTKVKWTRNRLANRAGVSPTCVNEYLEGKRRLTPENRTAIAQELGLKPEELPN